MCVSVLLQLDATSTVTVPFVLLTVYPHHNTVLKLRNKRQFRCSASCLFMCSSYYLLLYLRLTTCWHYYYYYYHYYYYYCYYYYCYYYYVIRTTYYVLRTTYYYYYCYDDDDYYYYSCCCCYCEYSCYDYYIPVLQRKVAFLQYSVFDCLSQKCDALRIPMMLWCMLMMLVNMVHECSGLCS